MMVGTCHQVLVQAPRNVQQRERPVRRTLDWVVTTCLAGSRTVTKRRPGEQVPTGGCAREDGLTVLYAVLLWT